MEVLGAFDGDEFMSAFMRLRNTPELQRQIMIEVYYPDLLNLCQVSKEVNALCDEFLFKMKAKRDFGVTQRKHADNWKEEYRVLFEERQERISEVEAMWEAKDVLMEEVLGSDLLPEVNKYPVMKGY